MNGNYYKLKFNLYCNCTGEYLWCKVFDLVVLSLNGSVKSEVRVYKTSLYMLCI